MPGPTRSAPPARGYEQAVKKDKGQGDVSGRATPDARRALSEERSENLGDYREGGVIPQGSRVAEETSDAFHTTPEQQDREAARNASPEDVPKDLP